MNKAVKNILVGTSIAVFGVAGLSIFFKARDNNFGYQLSDHSKSFYVKARDEYLSNYENKFGVKVTKNDLDNKKINSMDTLKKVKGDVSLYEFMTQNNNRTSRPLISFENQKVEDKYYALNDLSPNELRKMKLSEMSSLQDDIQKRLNSSEVERYAMLKTYSVLFAKELRIFADANKKRFKDGEALDVVVKKLNKSDYVLVLEQMIKRESLNRVSNKKSKDELRAARIDVMNDFFTPTIITSVTLSEMNPELNLFDRKDDAEVQEDDSNNPSLNENDQRIIQSM